MFDDIIATHAFGLEVTMSGEISKNVIICGKNIDSKKELLNSLTDAENYNKRLDNHIESETNTQVVEGLTIVYKFSLVPELYMNCVNHEKVFENCDAIIYVTKKNGFLKKKLITLEKMLDDYEEANYVMRLLSHKSLTNKPILFGYENKDTCKKELTQFYSLPHLQCNRVVKAAQILKNTTEDRINLKRVIQASEISS